MDTLTIKYKKEPIYTIYFEDSYELLEKMIFGLDVIGRKVCIVTDDNVAKYYLDNVMDILGNCFDKVVSFIFQEGEDNKNLNTVNELYEKLVIEKFDRNDLLIALGGGVVGDLTGFAAATYLRGIRFIQMPTSLLAQVDSSIGGKTGVDFKGYKNMVGAFNQPIAVYTNLGTLETLDNRQFYSGLGEIIKHGLIKDKLYFKWLILSVDKIKSRNISTLSDMIYKSCSIKKSVVENDPNEKGDRALLNFGHTLGHSIEKLMNFKLLHGECVSIGMVLSSYISYKRGNISKYDYDGIIDLLTKFELPVTISGLNADDIIEAAKNDKKMDSGIIKFILLENIGKAVIVKDVTGDEMADAIEAISA